MKKTKDLNFLDFFLSPHGLRTLGAFHPNNKDCNLKNIRTMVLIGPDEPNFWQIFKESCEFKDGLKDPLDRWSLRVINRLAEQLDAISFFPFGEGETMPFVKWALRTGQSFISPVNFLVHVDLGLFVSFRGALGFEQKLHITELTKGYPCEECTRPCIVACPAEAISLNSYDDSKCREYLKRQADKLCDLGCMVRRSCPVGQDKRLSEQSKFHMCAFNSSKI